MRTPGVRTEPQREVDPLCFSSFPSVSPLAPARSVLSLVPQLDGNSCDLLSRFCLMGWSGEFSQPHRNPGKLDPTGRGWVSWSVGSAGSDRGSTLGLAVSTLVLAGGTLGHAGGTLGLAGACFAGSKWPGEAKLRR